MDGNFYDATVQKIPGDGTVVVNWLRPRPMGPDVASPPGRVLVTISEAGGDDSLHRIVLQEDVQPLGIEPQSSESKEALLLFCARGEEDLACVDCGAPEADWASISFGTYLCQACVEEHRKLGVRLNYVKPLSDGWGWERQELQYLSQGGNKAFKAQFERFPMLQAAPIADRYASRFAEHYRRQLDAQCLGIPAPSSLGAEMASQPAQGEFLSAVEAIALARELADKFENAMSAVSLHGPVPTRLRPTTTPPRDGQVPASTSVIAQQVGKVAKIAAC